MKKINVVLFLVAVVGLIVYLQQCGSSGSSSGGSTSSSSVTTNMQTISENMAPASLDYSSKIAASVVRADGDNPCADVDGVAECQPILVQLYINTAQEMFDGVRNMIGSVVDNMSDIADGASGTTTDDGMTIQYSKTSDAVFSVLISSGGTVIGYVDVNGGVYTIKMDLSQMAEASYDSNFQAVITYTDDNNWSANFLDISTSCDADDVEAPSIMNIIIARADSIWTGKTMLYSPRWLGDGSTPTCDMEVTDSTAVNMYTDFVANDTAAKASLYLMYRTVSDLSDIEQYALNNISIPGTDTSTYINPFCTQPNTLDFTWNDDCTSVDSTVAAASYSSADLWIVPSEFYQTTIDIPGSL